MEAAAPAVEAAAVPVGMGASPSLACQKALFGTVLPFRSLFWHPVGTGLAAAQSAQAASLQATYERTSPSAVNLNDLPFSPPCGHVTTSRVSLGFHGPSSNTRQLQYRHIACQDIRSNRQNVKETLRIQKKIHIRRPCSAWESGTRQ